MRAVYLFNKQRPALTYIDIQYWFAKLSQNSPEWYHNAIDDIFYSPPLYIRFVKAGSLIGYRWQNDPNPKYDDRFLERSRRNPCEVNWLDPVPDRESISYEEYVEELSSQVKLYRGFYQPPTEEEYTRLFEERW